MGDDYARNGRPGVLRPLAQLGGRAAATTLRPFSGAVGLAVEYGKNLERRAVDRALDSHELERVIVATIDSTRVQGAIQQALESDTAKRAVDMFFDSGLFDRFIERLAGSESLWRLIDEIAQSDSVTAAISQQGLGFADEVGEQVRGRSRKADDWLERTAQRLIRRKPPPLTTEPNPGT